MVKDKSIVNAGHYDEVSAVFNLELFVDGCDDGVAVHVPDELLESPNGWLAEPVKVFTVEPLLFSELGEATVGPANSRNVRAEEECLAEQPLGF